MPGIPNESRQEPNRSEPIRDTNAPAAPFEPRFKSRRGPPAFWKKQVNRYDAQDPNCPRRAVSTLKGWKLHGRKSYTTPLDAAA